MCRGSRQVGLWMVVGESASGVFFEQSLLDKPVDGAGSRPGLTEGLPGRDRSPPVQRAAQALAGVAVFWTSDTGIDGENPVDVPPLPERAL